MDRRPQLTPTNPDTMTTTAARRTLADLIADPAEPLDLPALRQDIHRARREFTDEELTDHEHAARLDALATLEAAAMRDAIAAVAAARAHTMPRLPDVSAALAALPFDALGDDYKRDPEAACRRALRLTRSIRQSRFRRLRAIDRLLGMHGVGAVYYRNGAHAFNYTNAGDSYACTVILFPSGAFRVTSWGDIVERNPNRYA